MSQPHPVIGILHPQPGFTGSLDTGFQMFDAPCGIDGLARVNGTELHLLAVHAATPGNGQFREFVRQCKEAYTFIRFWAVVNDPLRPVLARYGFTPGHDVDKNAEIEEVWDWRLPPCPRCKALVRFVQSLTIRNYTTDSGDGTENQSDRAAIDANTRKCPQCGFTVGRDMPEFWNY